MCALFCFVLTLMASPFNSKSRPEAENSALRHQLAALSLGQKIQMLKAANEGEIDAAFVAMARERPDALLLGPDPFLVSRREQIVTLANHYKLPALYLWREFAEAAGPATYRPTHTKPYRPRAIHT